MGEGEEEEEESEEEGKKVIRRFNKGQETDASVDKEERDMNWVDPELSSLPSEGQSQINFGASDDSLQQKWRVRDCQVAPKIKFKTNK